MPSWILKKIKNHDTLCCFSNPNQKLITEQRTTSTTYEKLLLHIIKEIIQIWVKNKPSILRIFQIDELSAQNLPDRCIGSLHPQPYCGLSTQHPIHGEEWHQLPLFQIWLKTYPNSITMIRHFLCEQEPSKSNYQFLPPQGSSDPQNSSQSAVANKNK